MLLEIFLGAVGTSLLVPIYYIIKRRGGRAANDVIFHEDLPNPFHAHERSVRLKPVRNQPVVCQICMGRLKQGLPYFKCECGKIFHITCIKRTGFCPYCHHGYSMDEVEEGSIHPAEENLICPVCGESVPKDTGICRCGSIIADEQGNFYCPSCNTLIEDDENICPFCHESFEELELTDCPYCGRLIDASEGVCPCGAFNGERCPECGCPLDMDEKECPNCGTRFELL